MSRFILDEFFEKKNPSPITYNPYHYPESLPHWDTIYLCHYGAKEFEQKYHKRLMPFACIEKRCDIHKGKSKHAPRIREYGVLSGSFYLSTTDIFNEMLDMAHAIEKKHNCRSLTSSYPLTPSSRVSGV